MITKALIRNTLDSLPDNVTMEQVIEHLIFLDKVQKGMDDSDNGLVNTVEEAKQKLNKWLK
jgi:predicted transcriptional regulator